MPLLKRTMLLAVSVVLPWAFQTLDSVMSPTLTTPVVVSVPVPPSVPALRLAVVVERAELPPKVPPETLSPLAKWVEPRLKLAAPPLKTKEPEVAMPSVLPALKSTVPPETRKRPAPATPLPVPKLREEARFSSAPLATV